MRKLDNRTLIIAAVMFFSASVNSCQTKTTNVAQDHREKLAVLPFALHGVSPEEGAKLTRRFADIAGESGRFEVILADSVQGVEGTSQPRILADVGKALGVQKIVQVDVVRLEKRDILRIRLVNVGDGVLLYSERVDYSGDRDSLLSNIIPEQARKLCHAHLDAETPWGKGALLFGACLAAIIWVFWHFRRRVAGTEGSVSKRI